jgi:hypothetical protein
MVEKYWCEYNDWASNTSYWRAFPHRPNWLCMAQADQIIMFDPSSKQYTVVKSRKSIDASVITTEDMQWIILCAQQD